MNNISIDVGSNLVEYIECPHCGYIHDDVLKLDFGINTGVGQGIQMWCDGCTKSFMSKRIVIVRYISKKI